MVSMNAKKKISVSMITIIMVFIVGFLLGASMLTGFIGYNEQAFLPNEIPVPIWEPGEFWTYTFKTPELDDVISRMVVTSNDGTNYQVGATSRTDAQRHAVLNYNPMLGRITTENLAVYEKGIPQPLLSFPLRKNSQWSFSLFDVEEFNAQVKSFREADLPGGGSTVIVDIEAASSTGEELTYSYDTSAKWVRSLIYEDPSGTVLLDMTLVSFGSGFSGEAYFVRARDLFDETYVSDRGSPKLDFYNSFYDQGHPDWGPWDYLVYYYEISTNDNSEGTITVADPASKDAVKRVFGPNTFESALGTIPSVSGEWKVAVILGGESYLGLRVAGGIEYVWTV